jgi:PAS domain S-box-containing protein
MEELSRAALEQRIASLEAEVAELRETRDVRAVLESVLGSAPNFIVRITPDGTIRFINHVMPGYTREQVVGSTVWQYNPPELHETMRACFARVMATGQPDGYESVAAGSPGEQRHYYTRVGAIFDGDEVTGLIVVATDLTEIVTVRGKLDLAIAASGVGFWSWDAIADVVTWDDATCRAFGVSRAEAPVNMKGFLERVSPGDRTMVISRGGSLVSDAAAGAGIEFRTTTPSGEPRWIMSTGEVVRDGCGRVLGMRGGMIDVTEQRRLEERLAQARRLEAVGQLAAGVAHNVNNMLAAIIPTVELAARHAPQAGEYLAVVRESALRAAGVVRQLMAFAGRRPASPTTPECVTSIAARTIELARAMLGRSIEVVLEVPPGFSAAVAVDAGELEQALMNLIVNARDALGELEPDGGAAIDARIEVVLDGGEPAGAADGAAWVRLAVSDNGAGMDDETRARAIEPFFTTKRLGLGTGLGLSSVYAFTVRAGGSLDIASRRRHGTTVSMFLPVAATPPGPREPAVDPLRGRGERLLIVDDDVLVRTALSRVLIDAGYQVTALADPRVVLATWDTVGYDAVILDESMPGLTGSKLLEALRSHDAGVRAISISGLDRPVTGAQVHLTKPVSTAELLRTVRSVIAPP